MSAEECLDPCELLRATVAEYELKLYNVSRGLARFDYLRNPPNPQQERRMRELTEQREQLERLQRAARARLRDCEHRQQSVLAEA